jgi:hypothetical protein
LAPRTDRRRSPLLAECLVLAGVVALTTWWLWPTSGTSDVDIWLGWIDTLLTKGPVAGYAATGTDYPPVGLFTLWAVARLAGVAGVDVHLALKLLVFAFLATTTFLLLVASRRPVVAAFAYLAFSLNALGLLYLDILFAPFVIGAVWAGSTGRLALMQVLIAFGCLMKWQPVLLLPFALVYAIRQRDVMPPNDWNRSMRLTGAVVSTLAVVVLVVWGWPVAESFYRASRHNNISNFGANPLWVLTWWLERGSAERLSTGGIVSILPASRPLLRVLTLFTLIGFVSALRSYWKSGDRSIEGWLSYSLVGYLVYFLISAGVHENHLFLGSLVAIALTWQNGRWWWVAATVALAANLNLLAFYGWTGFVTRRMVAGMDVTVWLAVAISAALGAVAFVLARRRGVPSKMG